MSTRCWCCSRRSGGSGRAPTCCSSSRRPRSRSARCPSTGSRAAPRLATRAGLGFALTYLVYPPTTWLALNEFHPGRARDAGCSSSRSGTSTRTGWSRSRRSPCSPRSPRRTLPLVVAAMASGTGSRAGGGAGRDDRARRARRGRSSRSTLVSRISAAARRPSSAATARRTRRRCTHSWTLFSLAFDHIGLRYLFALVLPLAGLCLLAPIALAASTRRSRLNLLSAVPAQSSIHFHYTAAVIPPLVAAAVLGGARVRARVGAPVASIALGCALIGNYLLGAIPLWNELPHGESLQSRAAVVTEHDRVAARGSRADSAARSGQRDQLARRAPLRARGASSAFPYIEDAKWIAVDETRPGYADRLAPLPHRSTGRLAAHGTRRGGSSSSATACSCSAASCRLRVGSSAAAGRRRARARAEPQARRLRPQRAGPPTTTYQTTRYGTARSSAHAARPRRARPRHASRSEPCVRDEERDEEQPIAMPCGTPSCSARCGNAQLVS